LREDPRSSSQTAGYQSYIVKISSNNISLDLNQDLSKFWRRNERAESKRDLVSHNVPYGIFRATPKKRANSRLYYTVCI
jgi:hypothetical protein